MSESPTPGLTVSEVLSNRKSFALCHSAHHLITHEITLSPLQELEYEEIEEDTERCTTPTRRALHLSTSPEPAIDQHFSESTHNSIVSNNNHHCEETNITPTAICESCNNYNVDTIIKETSPEPIPWIWWNSEEEEEEEELLEEREEEQEKRLSPSPRSLPSSLLSGEAHESTKQLSFLEEEVKEIKYSKEASMTNKIVETETAFLEAESKEKIESRQEASLHTCEVKPSFPSFQESEQLIEKSSSQVEEEEEEEEYEEWKQEQEREQKQENEEELSFKCEEEEVCSTNKDDNNNNSVNTNDKSDLLYTCEVENEEVFQHDKHEQEGEEQQVHEQFTITSEKQEEEEREQQEQEELEPKKSPEKVLSYAELQRLSAQWVPCPLSGFPPRYRNTMGGYYCSYCSYSVCEACYHLIPPSLLCNKNDNNSNNNNNNNNNDINSSNQDLVKGNTLTSSSNLECSPLSILSSPVGVTNSKINEKQDTYRYTANQLHREQSRKSASITKCHLCKTGNLIYEELLLHEWSCEGPLPAVRLKRGANIAYDTNLLQRYYYIKEQREVRANSTEPLIAHYYGMTRTRVSKQQNQLHEEIADIANLPDNLVCFDNRPYCVLEGESFIFNVDNHRLVVPCVWCAVSLAPTTTTITTSSRQHSTSCVEQLSQEHISFSKNSINSNSSSNNNNTHHTKTNSNNMNDIMYYAYSITPLLIWKCPSSLPALRAKLFALHIPEKSYRDHHIHAFVLYELSEIYRKATTQLIPMHGTSEALRSSLSEVKNNDNNNNNYNLFTHHREYYKSKPVTHIPLSSMSSVKVFPSQMLKPLLMINVIHNDRVSCNAYDSSSNDNTNSKLLSHVKIPKELSVALHTENSKHTCNKRNVKFLKSKKRTRLEKEQEQKIVQVPESEEEQTLHHKGKREQWEEQEEEILTTTTTTRRRREEESFCNSKSNGQKHKQPERANTMCNQGQLSDNELDYETATVVAHIKAGRHVAVFGIGCKHFFVHHVTHCSSLLHYPLFVIDPIRISHTHSNESSKAVTLLLLRELRELDAYLEKQHNDNNYCNNNNNNNNNNNSSSSNITLLSKSKQENYPAKASSTWSSKTSKQIHINVSGNNNQGQVINTPDNDNTSNNIDITDNNKTSLLDDVEEVNAFSQTANEAQSIKITRWRSFHLSDNIIDDEDGKTDNNMIYKVTPRITFANEALRETVLTRLQSVVRRHTRSRCVRWNYLPSFLRSETNEAETCQSSHTKRKKQLLETTPRSNLFVSDEHEEQLLEEQEQEQQQWEEEEEEQELLLKSLPVIVVIHNIDQLSETVIQYLVKLCSKWVPSSHSLQLLCSFDDPEWLAMSSICVPLAQLLHILSPALIIHELRSLLLPRVHEHQHLSPLHLLTQYEGITSSLTNQNAGSHINRSSTRSAVQPLSHSLRNARYNNNSNNNNITMGKRGKLTNFGTSAPLQDTMRRILLSLPATFTELLSIVLATQDEAGDGVYLSLFHHMEQFEKNGLMVSQARLKKFQQELISNRLASYNSAEHSLVIHQHRRLQRVLDEVNVMRANKNKPSNTNTKANDTSTTTNNTIIN